jgi:hypothetical protein
MRGSVKFTLAPSVMAELEKRASTCGLRTALYVRELVESFLAGEQCRHGEASPEAQDAEAPQDD